MNRSPISRLVSDVERKRIDRRTFFKGAAALGLGQAAASLALTTGSLTLDTRRAEAMQANADGYVTIVNESITTFTRNLNPMGPAGASTRYAPGLSIYEGLMTWNWLKAEFNASLANAYAFSDDNLELTYFLVPGVTWSDGTPFTSKDVVFTWDLFPKFEGLAGTGARGVLDHIEKWEAVDDLTVKFTFKNVFTPGLAYVSEQLIVPEHIWKDVADPVKFANETPIGTGPFTEVERFESQIYQMGRNPKYRFADKLKLKGLRFSASGDNAATALALTNGDIDWTQIFFPDIDNVYVAKDPEHNKYFFPISNGTVVLWANTMRKPFDDVKVRKAISMILDRPSMCENALYGYSKPADASGLSPVYDNRKSEETKQSTWTQQNIDEAKKLLAEAGVAENSQIELLTVAPFSDYVALAQMMEADFKKAGLKLNIKTVDPAVWEEAIGKGEFDITIRWSDAGATEYEFYNSCMSDVSITESTNTTNANFGRWFTDESKALLKEFTATSDEEKSKEISAKLQKLFIENAPTIPMHNGPVVTEYTTHRVLGFPSKEDPYGSPHPTSTNGKQVAMRLYPVGDSPSDFTGVFDVENRSGGGGASPAASPAATPGATPKM